MQLDIQQSVAIDPLQPIVEEVKPEVFDTYLMYLYLLYVEDALLGIWIIIIDRYIGRQINR